MGQVSVSWPQQTIAALALKISLTTQVRRNQGSSNNGHSSTKEEALIPSSNGSWILTRSLPVASDGVPCSYQLLMVLIVRMAFLVISLPSPNHPITLSALR
jgi:hypothetical protein